MTRTTANTISYQGKIDLGDNLIDLNWLQCIDLNTVNGSLIICLSPLKEWIQFHHKTLNVLPIPLPGCRGKHTYVILMMA